MDPVLETPSARAVLSEPPSAWTVAPVKREPPSAWTVAPAESEPPSVLTVTPDDELPSARTGVADVGPRPGGRGSWVLERTM
jgi:hypothetical protein